LQVVFPMETYRFLVVVIQTVTRAVDQSKRYINDNGRFYQI